MLLSANTEIKVRFNEVDQLGITWHGHYLRFFEDGREAFGLKYGLGYMDFYHQGYIVPLVSIHCDYKKPLKYADVAVVETTFRDSPAAKINFMYKIFLQASGELIAEGYSVQVFVNRENMQLQLTFPPFFEAWKNKFLRSGF